MLAPLEGAEMYTDICDTRLFRSHYFETIEA
jgi:hypothetical protein